MGVWGCVGVSGGVLGRVGGGGVKCFHSNL